MPGLNDRLTLYLYPISVGGGCAFLKPPAGWSILASVLEQNYGLIRVRVPTIVSSPRGRDFFDGRSTPRIANRLLRRVRDFAQVNELPIVTREVALGASELLERSMRAALTKWTARSWQR